MTIAATGFDPARIAEPGYFAEGRLPAHSDHRWFAAAAQAATGDSSYELCLNGTWKFHYAENLSGSVPGFEAAGFDAGFMVSEHFHPWTPQQGQSAFAWSLLAQTYAADVGGRSTNLGMATRAEWLRRGYWANRYERQARRFVSLRVSTHGLRTIEKKGIRPTVIEYLKTL